jgi:hypothetical protein
MMVKSSQDRRSSQPPIGTGPPGIGRSEGVKVIAAGLVHPMRVASVGSPTAAGTPAFRPRGTLFIAGGFAVDDVVARGG